MKFTPCDSGIAGIRFGMCYAFQEQPIKFRTTTVTSLKKMSLPDRREKLSTLCLHNARSLLAALGFCQAHNIGCFRIVGNILPVKTHPDVGYEVHELPEGETIIAEFWRCGQFAAEHDIRTVFHADRYVVLNSQKPQVVLNSIAELEYLAEIAEWVHADVLNIQGGGAYGNKVAALDSLCRTLDQLSDEVRSRLTIENDHKIYTPTDLLPICRDAEIPFVYDVHHHRCHPDSLTVLEASEQAIETWDREPLFHISSPRDGWQGPKPHRHHEFIDPLDFPACWLGRKLTVEVLAKAKELAVMRLMQDVSTDCKII